MSITRSSQIPICRGDVIMNMRTIMIFPEFENIDNINDIRKKYDPLADLVLPHITLVFPFDSELTILHSE